MDMPVGKVLGLTLTIAHSSSIGHCKSTPTDCPVAALHAKCIAIVSGSSASTDAEFCLDR